MYAILIDNTFIINNRLCKADYRRMTSNPQLGLYGVKLTRNARSALLPKRVPRGWTQGTRGILLRTSERGPNGAPPDSPRADISLDTHDRDPKPPLRHCFRCPCCFVIASVALVLVLLLFCGIGLSQQCPGQCPNGTACYTGTCQHVPPPRESVPCCPL